MNPLNQNIWKNFGLKGNPFDTRALALRSSYLPVKKAFAGRTSKSRENIFITNILCNPGGACFVVEGDIGVGKTSFVNYHRAMWENEAEDKLFTPEKEIAVNSDWTVKDFLINILRGLIDKLLVSENAHIIENDNVLKKIKLLTDVYLNDHYNYGANIFHLGFSISKDEVINMPIISETLLVKYLEHFVSKIKELGYTGVFIHLDNIELIATNVKKAQMLFENFRDTLQIPNIYFALVSAKGFYQNVISPRERLRSIFFGRPILLPPLSLKEVHIAFQKRYQLLKMKKKTYIEPFQKNFISYLYKIYQGKIRFIMEAINTLIPFLNYGKTSTLALQESKNKLREILQENIASHITPQEWEILEIAETFSEFSSKDISKKLDLQISNVSRSIKKFLQKGIIYQIHRTGRTYYYQIHEDIRIILDNPVKQTQSRKLSCMEKRIISMEKFLNTRETFTTKEYAIKANTSLQTARKDLKYLIKIQRIKEEGRTKNKFYHIL